MKKYLLLFLFWFFGLLFTQTTYWTVAPVYTFCDKFIRPIIINPNGIDWYKLVSFTWFYWSAEEIKWFSIVTWFIFLIPDDLDFNDIRPIKLAEEPIRWTDWEPNSYFRIEENIIWGLDNYGTKFLTRLYDKDDFRCSHYKTFHLIEFYKLWKNDEWDVVLNEIVSLSYDKSSIIKYILYFLWFVIAIYWIVYFIKRRKKKYLVFDINI